ncbi:hypothetical protein AB3S75_027719 [Citrus x aurantiifolia]
MLSLSLSRPLSLSPAPVSILLLGSLTVSPSGLGVSLSLSHCRNSRIIQPLAIMIQLDHDRGYMTDRDRDLATSSPRASYCRCGLVQPLLSRRRVGNLMRLRIKLS